MRFFLIFSMLFSLQAQKSIKIMDGELNYLFNERLTGRDIIALRNGEVVCNSIGKLKYSRINEIPETRKMLASIKKVNPNHLVEIIKILPYKDFENLTDIISAMLKESESYTKVPFYYDDDGRIRYLYSDATIESIELENGREIITERFLMRPLDYFTGRIESEQLGNYYFYQMRNTDKVRYRNIISAIGKGKMIAVITLFRYGDNWIIYAFGGVDTIRFPFLNKRIDNAFYRRIKAFCFFTFERLAELSSADEES